MHLHAKKIGSTRASVLREITSQFLNNTDSSALWRSGRGGALLRKGMSCHYSKLVVNEFLLVNRDEAIGQRHNAESR